MSMTDIQGMMREMKIQKDKDQKELNKLSWKKTRRTREIIKMENQEKLENKEVEVDLPKVKSKEDVYLEMKDKFKYAWKSPGYVNSEFSQIPTLRGRILNEWDIERINLAERSYKAPFGFKGFKIPSQFNEFQRPPTPKQYKTHLDGFRLKYDEFVQRPTKYGKVHEDELLDMVRANNKEPFKYVNTIKQNDFGFDPHRTWEAEQTRKQNSKVNRRTRQS